MTLFKLFFLLSIFSLTKCFHTSTSGRSSTYTNGKIEPFFPTWSTSTHGTQSSKAYTKSGKTFAIIDMFPFSTSTHGTHSNKESTITIHYDEFIFTSSTHGTHGNKFSTSTHVAHGYKASTTSGIPSFPFTTSPHGTHSNHESTTTIHYDDFIFTSSTHGIHADKFSTSTHGTHGHKASTTSGISTFPFSHFDPSIHPQKPMASHTTNKASSTSTAESLILTVTSTKTLQSTGSTDIESNCCNFKNVTG